MKTAAAYIRVSTEDQLEFSPESQIKTIKKYADEHGYSLPEEYIFVDKGISGKSVKNRTEFIKMIEKAKNAPKLFDVILVWKFSRFARNREDSVVYKSMLKKKFNISVVSVSEHLSDDPTSILIEALLEAMDEYYSINLAQEVKRGMNEKFLRGGIINAPPFGYKKGDFSFEVDKQSSKVVKMIFEDFLSGLSLRSIAVKLNNLGVYTNRGNKFDVRSVKYILTNPVYAGKLRMKKEKCAGKFDVINGIHRPLISKNDFEKVQKILKWHENLNLKSRKKSIHMLSDLVFCSNCGSKLTVYVKNNFLQCGKYSKGICKVSHGISAAKISEVILKKLKDDIGDEKINIIVNPKKQKNEIEILKNSIIKENKKILKIEKAYEIGADTLEEYKAKKHLQKEKISDLINQLNSKKRLKLASNVNLKINFFKLVKILKSDKISETLKNQILKSFISRIVFSRKENNVKIFYYI
ncbi:MAG: recombinase family protein [Clostridia bacterium]|nr:recombinase family protein [Clostridia bacterium]